MSTAATVIVSIVGFIAFFYVNLYAGSYRMRRAATQFLDALVQRRHYTAYELMSSAFQSLIDKRDFEQFLSERGLTSIKKFTRSHGDFSIGVDRGTVKPLLIREDGVHFPVELEMRRERMAWRVSAIDAQVRLAPGPLIKVANDPHVDFMKVRVAPSYTSMFRMQLRMLFFSPVGWVLATIFPLGGGYMLYRWIAISGVPSIPDLVLAVCAVLALPLYAALIVSLVRLNESARAPFTYIFDSEGVHVVGDSGNASHAWREIARVAESAGFMFIFIERGRAQVVPLRSLSEAGCLDTVRELVKQKVVGAK